MRLRSIVRGGERKTYLSTAMAVVVQKATEGKTSYLVCYELRAGQQSGD